MKSAVLMQRGVKEVAVVVIGFVLVASSVFAFAPRAQAAALTEPQIQAILNLLISFNVPAATVANVNIILHKSK